jgi:Protein of unknown function (DUF3325)
MNVPSLMFAIAGFCGLASSMRRHAAQMELKTPLRFWRAGGWFALCLSFAVLLRHLDWPMAAVTWIGQAALAAALCVGVLSLRPRMLGPTLVISAMIGVFDAVYH